MINKIKLNPKYHSITVRVISSIIFTLLFVLICVVFEFVYSGSVTNQINKLIHEILFFGV
jgi:sensor histidine kinase YesM